MPRQFIGSTGASACSVAFSQAAPCDDCHAGERAQGVKATAVASTSSTTIPRRKPKPAPSTRSKARSGEVLMSRLISRVAMPQAISARMKVATKAAPWFSDEPEAPIGTYGASCGANHCAAK